MPIYEFKCVNCNELNEFLLVNKDEEVELKCRKCNSFELERVMSATHYATGTSEKNTQVSSQTRTCGSGTCSTYDIPGHCR
ncbi:MAG: FmdB family transcriptional regulator [Deltaproteobacteria bacterium RBG_13_49_15]|nr:MAG: FmdB family transcriptional regulator [Deltaproteobacteria bacterium RBG_13_49_15]